MIPFSQLWLIPIVVFPAFFHTSFLFAGGLQSKGAYEYEPVATNGHTLQKNPTGQDGEEKEEKKEDAPHSNHTQHDENLRDAQYLLDLAVRGGKIDRIRDYLLNPQQENIFRPGEWNLAHFAAMAGSTETLHLLLENHQENLFLMGVFLDAKVPPACEFRRNPVPAYQLSDNHRLKPLEIPQSLFREILKQKTSSVFLQSPAMLWLKVTPLVLAVVHAKVEAAEYLLNHDSLSQLIQESEVTWLLPPKVNPSVSSFLRKPDSRNRVSLGALLWTAAAQNQWRLFELLLGKANASEVDLEIFYRIVEIGKLPLSQWKTFQEKLAETLARKVAGTSNEDTFAVLSAKTQDHSQSLVEGSWNWKVSQELESLHRAAQLGDVPMVLKVLQLPELDLKIRNPNGFQLSHTAAYHGQVGVLKALTERFLPSDWDLPAGAPSAFTSLGRSYEGCRPLDIALLRGKASIAHSLLDILLASDPQGTSIRKSFETPCLAYQGLSPFVWASKKPELWSVLERLLERLPDLVSKKYPKDDGNFLHQIASSGFRLSQLPSGLLRCIPSAAWEVKDRFGNRPGDLEIQNLSTDPLPHLVTALGLTVGHFKNQPPEKIFQNLRSDSSLQKLYSIPRWGTVQGWGAEQVAAFLDQVGAHTSSMRQLFSAIETRSPEEVLQILQLNPELKRMHDVRGWGLVHVAAFLGRVDILKYLWAECFDLDFFEQTTPGQDDPYRPSIAGLSPLTLALRYASEEAVSMRVLQFYQKAFPWSYASILDIEDLRMALFKSFWELAQRLVSVLDSEEIYMSNSHGENIFHLLVQYKFHPDWLGRYVPIRLDPALFYFHNHEGKTPFALYWELNRRR